MLIDIAQKDAGYLLLLDGSSDSIVENVGEVPTTWQVKIERNSRGQITKFNPSASEATVPE
jgi:hypothetical protein